MNSCPNKNILAAFQLHLLDDQEMEEIERHIKGCKECQKEMKLEAAVKGVLSEKIEPHEIETTVMRKVKVLRDTPFPAATFGYRFWQTIVYTFSGIGLAYAFLSYLGRLSTVEYINDWMIRMVGLLGGFSRGHTWLIATASICFSMCIFAFCKLYGHRIRI